MTVEKIELRKRLTLVELERIAYNAEEMPYAYANAMKSRMLQDCDAHAQEQLASRNPRKVQEAFTETRNLSPLLEEPYIEFTAEQWYKVDNEA